VVFKGESEPWQSNLYYLFTFIKVLGIWSIWISLRKNVIKLAKLNVDFALNINGSYYFFDIPSIIIPNIIYLSVKPQHEKHEKL